MRQKKENFFYTTFIGFLFFCFDVIIVLRLKTQTKLINIKKKKSVKFIHGIRSEDLNTILLIYVYIAGGNKLYADLYSIMATS